MVHEKDDNHPLRRIDDDTRSPKSQHQPAIASHQPQPDHLFIQIKQQSQLLFSL